MDSAMHRQSRRSCCLLSSGKPVSLCICTSLSSRIYLCLVLDPWLKPWLMMVLCTGCSLQKVAADSILTHILFY
uniref:Uncharacterized protein n=1 Tax=Arundo donax TaxID=35708 RepID=A0A0A9FYN2_ARUDO